ncbi:MAG: PDZ domain-containing protein [Candidatus Aminicenantes bacterium]|nr:PDZ domain-containing protein [Candidatus Aminicenantes bacterium]
MSKKTKSVFTLPVFLLVIFMSVSANTSDAAAEEVNIADLTKKVYPSVVKVEARNGMRKIATGVVIDEDGYIVTTALISPRDERLFVITAEGERIDAEFLGMDSVTHLALIRAKNIKLRPIAIGKTEDVPPGEWIGVVSISPENTPAVTQGIVSSVASDKVRLNVWLIPGASGSPVVDGRGRLVGLIRGAYFDSNVTLQMIQRTTEGVFVDRATAPSSGMAMAIPVHVVDYVCREIRKEGKMRRGWLGVLIIENEEGEVEITDIEEESPAELSKLKKGDVILEFEGKKVTGTKMLSEEIRMRKPGEDISLKVRRKDHPMDVEVKLGEYSEKDIFREFEFQFPRLFSSKKIKPDKFFKGDEPNVFQWQEREQKYIGIYIQELNRELSEHFGVKEGRGLLVSKIEEGSPAAEAGLEVGDVIVKAGGKRIEDMRELSELVQGKEKGDKISIEFIRNGKEKTVEVKVDEREGGFHSFSSYWDAHSNVSKDSIDKARRYSEDYKRKFRDHSKKYLLDTKKHIRRIEADIQETLKNAREAWKKSAENAQNAFTSFYDKYRCIRV